MTLNFYCRRRIGYVHAFIMHGHLTLCAYSGSLFLVSDSVDAKFSLLQSLFLGALNKEVISD